MAMLAEPRQRKRYNLTPRGRALYEDDTRFGTKMLEKMGWSKGKGLGANENGSKDFVRVRMRNNNEGLGFEDRDDHWTEHEEGFNGLLKNLNGVSDDSEKAVLIDASDEEGARVGFGFSAKPKHTVQKLKAKVSGESLEEKSKRSKARVHYKKFTKGKDLSQYSEKDLANIFGKKVVEQQQANGIYEQFTAIRVEQDEKMKEKEEGAADEKEVNPNFAGVQTISTGLSVSEYFKQKMEAMKNRIKSGGGVASGDVEAKQAGEVEGETNDVGELVAKSKSKRKKQSFDDIEPADADANLEKASKRKKRKKNKKEYEEEEILVPDEIRAEKSAEDKARDVEIGSVGIALNEVSQTTKKKNKKKNKQENNENVVHLIENPAENGEIPESSTKKKNKKSKTKAQVLDSEMDTVNETQRNSQPATEATDPSKKIKGHNSKDNDVEQPIKVDSGARPKKSKKFRGTHAVTQAPKSVAVVKSKRRVSVAQMLADPSTTLDDLIARCNLYNIYTISSFCAEKFRNCVLEHFAGANLSQQPGYSYHDSELQLNVKVLPKDEERITQLWNCTVNKYRNANPKSRYYKYVGQVRAAHKTKQKLPRLNVKSWKRKNAFAGI